MIYISAGHQKGKGITKNGIEEGEAVIAIRDELKKIMPETPGVFYLPDDWNFAQTLEFLKKYAQPDDFALDIHLNSNNKAYLNGTEAYYSDKPDLADICSFLVAQSLSAVNLGAKHEKYSYYGSLGFLHLPCRSVIIEGCYLSNLGDVAKLKDGGGVKIAEGIFAAIKEIELKEKKISIIKRLIDLYLQVIGLIKKQ